MAKKATSKPSQLALDIAEIDMLIQAILRKAGMVVDANRTERMSDDNFTMLLEELGDAVDAWRKFNKRGRK